MGAGEPGPNVQMASIFDGLEVQPVGLDDADWDDAMELVGNMDMNALDVVANPPLFEVPQPSPFPLEFNAPEPEPQNMQFLPMLVSSRTFSSIIPG